MGQEVAAGPPGLLPALGSGLGTLGCLVEPATRLCGSPDHMEDPLQVSGHSPARAQPTATMTHREPEPWATSAPSVQAAQLLPSVAETSCPQQTCLGCGFMIKISPGVAAGHKVWGWFLCSSRRQGHVPSTKRPCAAQPPPGIFTPVNWGPSGPPLLGAVEGSACTYVVLGRLVSTQNLRLQPHLETGPLQVELVKMRPSP